MWYLWWLAPCIHLLSCGAHRITFSLFIDSLILLTRVIMTFIHLFLQYLIWLVLVQSQMFSLTFKFYFCYFLVYCLSGKIEVLFYPFCSWMIIKIVNFIGYPSVKPCQFTELILAAIFICELKFQIWYM